VFIAIEVFWDSVLLSKTSQEVFVSSSKMSSVPQNTPDGLPGHLFHFALVFLACLTTLHDVASTSALDILQLLHLKQLPTSFIPMICFTE